MDKLGEIGVYNVIFKEPILTFALLNFDRSELKETPDNFSTIDEKFTKD